MKVCLPTPSRRRFLEIASSFLAGLEWGGSVCSGNLPAVGHPQAQSLADLPKGAAPKPVSLPHFPSRLHAFVWRNWPLVTPERMARVVGAKRADILRLGRAMGLGKPPRIPAEQPMRSYITV